MPIKKTKYTIPIASTLILAIALYFIFKGTNKSQAAWDLVPADAIAVLNSDLLHDSTTLRTPADVELGDLPFIKQAYSSLDLLRWITPDEPVIEKTLYKKNITFSFHSRPGSDLGVVFYIPLESESEIKWWIKPNRSDIRVLNHVFQDIIIIDVNDIKSKPICSYIIKNDHLIVSSHGDLIEAVIRNSNESRNTFTLKNLFQGTNDRNYRVNLYAKRTLLQDLIFKKSEGQTSLSEFFALFPFYQDFHLKNSTSPTLSFEAFGSQKEDNYVAKWLNGQNSTVFKNHQHVSQQTALFFRIAGDNDDAFQKEFEAWHATFPSTAWEKVGYHLGKEKDKLLANVGAELLLCQLAETNSVSEGKLALIRYKNYESIRPVLTKLAKLSTEESNAAVDTYQGYDLYSIPISELPASMFGPVFEGFPRTYISFVAPYLVFSNSSQALRDYISDYENNLTWQQSSEMDSILTQHKHHVSLVANPQKITAPATNTWYSGIFNLDIESIQYECRLENKNAITQLSFIPRSRPTSPKVLNRTFLANEMKWNEGINNYITLDRNSLRGTGQLLLTGQDNILYKVSPDFKRNNYLYTLDGPLIGSSLQEDFLNIGRQQLIVSTPRSIYALDVDRAGVVTPFQASISSGSPIRAINRIEGTTEGASRFAVVDMADNVFLWERAGSSPRKINRFRTFTDVLTPVLSLNQLGSRSFLITQQNGLVYLMKEEGTVKNGFPIDLKTRFSGAFSWSQNAATGQPELIGVSEMGELITVSTTGTILERKQLLRPAASTRFRTVFDQNTRDWLLVRSSDTKVALLDKTGQELFELANVLPNAYLQYHYFGPDNRIISIKSGNYTSLFDTRGKKLGDQPIPSDLPVQLTYQASYNKLFIFGKTSDSYQSWSIKLR